MTLRRARTTAAAATTALAAALVVALPVTSAAADTYGPPRVTRDGDVDVFLTAYDPDDALGLDGDTHVIELTFRAGFPRPFSLWIMSYTCGPHDPSQLPDQLGCADAGSSSQVARRPSVDVLADDTLRVRGTTAAGRLDLTFTDSGQTQPGWEPFVSREWTRAVGTSREQGRTIAADYYARLTQGTWGGVALYQDEAWWYDATMRVRTTTVRTGTGPAVPIPDLPPPGTQEGPWTTYGQAQATWLRNLPSAGPAGTRDVEVGNVRYDEGHGGDPAGGGRQVQRCEPGERVDLPFADPPRRPCEVVDWGSDSSIDNATAALDVAAGRVGIELDLVPWPPGTPTTHVTFAWQGRRAVGYHEVETTRYDSVASLQTSTRNGVRWLRLDADGTVGGDRVDRVLGLDFTVYRQKLEMAPPP